MKVIRMQDRKAAKRAGVQGGEAETPPVAPQGEPAAPAAGRRPKLGLRYG